MDGAVKDSYRFALGAAEAAIERLGDSADDENRRSLIEAVWWIATCDDHLGAAYGSRWKTSAIRQRNSELLDGVFWARNRAFHDPLSLTTLERGGAFSDGFSNAFDTGWRWNDWRDVEKISVARGEPDPRIRNRRDAYGNALSGKAVHDTLSEAINALRSVKLNDLRANDENPQ